MPQFKAAGFKTSLCQGALGNASKNVLGYVFDGNEVNDDVILLGKFDKGNTYTSIKLLADSTTTGTVNIGYISRDPDEVDDPNFFTASPLTLTAVQQELIVLSKKLDFAHDLTMTVIDLGDIAADDVAEVVTTSVVSAG